VVSPIREVRHPSDIIAGNSADPLRSYVWAPTVLTLFILIGVAGPKFDIYTPSVGSGAVLVGNRLSYFFLTASGPLGWTSAAADYYAYYPPQTSKWMVFAMTAGGMIFGKLFIESLGIGLGSSLSTNADLAAAFKSHGVGALIVEAYAPLGNFGKFCAVILAVCVTANNIPGTYAAALNWQMFGRWFAKVPQPIWSTVTVIIYLVCAIGGRNHLFTIFTNFLSIIGYWTVGWVAMTIEEQVIFRRMSGYDWSMWNVKSALPVGYAAFVGFGVGWVGAVMGMYQTYYTGPIAKMVGSGADVSHSHSQ
jgi:purine-cytosine permease-like protein